jgi:hypothetical protein
MKFAGLEHFKPTSVPAAGAIVEVSGQRATKTLTSGASVQLAFPGAVVAGNLLVVAGFSRSGTGTHTITVTDSRGTTYTVVQGPVMGGEVVSFIAYGIAGGSGANTVTVGSDGSSPACSFAIDEFDNVSATPLDVDGGSSTGTSVEPSDSITTVATGALIIGLVVQNAGDAAPAASYIEIGEEAGRFNLVFRVVTVAQPYVASWTLSDVSAWTTQTISFKP